MQDMEPAKECLCEQTELHMDAITHARSALSDPYTVDALSELFKVLGDPTRIRILQVLHSVTRNRWTFLPLPAYVQ